MRIPLEVSARHVHLSQEAVDVLFGKGYVLKQKKNLSQPGQYACEERVELVGPKGTLKNVAVLGPVRENTQVEISATDSIKIGIKCPIRESGDLKGSSGCIILGPCGEYSLSEGLIIAKRHIHMNSEDAVKASVEDKQIVKVRIDSKKRSLIFDDVVVRVNDKFSLAMHIDTDEANAMNYEIGATGRIIL